MNLSYSFNVKETVVAPVQTTHKETTSPLYFHIKRLVKSSTLSTQRTQPVHPGLFQVAARFETCSVTQVVMSGPSRKHSPGKRPVQNNCGYSSAEHKWTEFKLEAPEAQTVKLAAEFTGWEKFPVDMIRSENGAWTISVPLAPGEYSYRFIVDDQWWTDPTTISAFSAGENDRMVAVA